MPYLTEVMPQFSRFELLPDDSLRDIMVRVAKAPTGATDIAHVFAVSKRFRSFSDDINVLGAVSFEDFYRGIAGRYVLFSEVQGLVVKSAIAGNQYALSILTKVLLISASILLTSRIEVGTSGWMRNIISYNKAARLVGHFSAGHTDPTQLLGLVRVFLAEANLLDMIEMQYYITDFATLYCRPGKEAQLQDFLSVLHYMCDTRQYNVQIETSNPLTFLAWACNKLFNMGYINMRSMGIDESQCLPLLQCMVEANEHVSYETLMHRLETVEPTLKHGGQRSLDVGDHTLALIQTCILCMVVILMEYVDLYRDHELLVQNNRRMVLERFDDLFDI